MLSFKYHEITLHSSRCLLTITWLAILLKLIAAVVVKKKIQLFQVWRDQLIEKLHDSLTEISSSNSKYVLYMYYIYCIYIYILDIYIYVYIYIYIYIYTHTHTFLFFNKYFNILQNLWYIFAIAWGDLNSWLEKAGVTKWGSFV